MLKLTRTQPGRIELSVSNADAITARIVNDRVVQERYALNVVNAATLDAWTVASIRTKKDGDPDYPGFNAVLITAKGD